MARMHSRKKGKSGSKRPLRKGTPTWLRYSRQEVEMLIVKLAKEGNPPSKIGLLLRDVYGIPDVKAVIGKKLGAFLAEKGLAQKLPEDLLALIKKSLAIRKHLEKHRKDQTAKRGLTLTESKIFRLAKYYKRIGKLPADWKYEPDKPRLYI